VQIILGAGVVLISLLFYSLVLYKRARESWIPVAHVYLAPQDSAYTCFSWIWRAAWTHYGWLHQGSWLSLPKSTFKKNLKREDGLLISKIKYFKLILANCRLDIMIFILYVGNYLREPVGARCRISSCTIYCLESPAVIQPYQPWFHCLIRSQKANSILFNLQIKFSSMAF
jgi:hypothetical protein